MNAILIRLIAVAAALGAVAAAPPDYGVDRPGGVYAYVPASDAAACAASCSLDRICLAWSYNSTEFVGCSLKAVVPAAVADSNITSGLAERAAGFVALTTPPGPAMSRPAASEPRAPGKIMMASAPAKAAPPPAPAIPQAAAASPSDQQPAAVRTTYKPPAADDDELLGGP